MRGFGYLTLGLLLAAATAHAVDKRAAAGTLAREATPARSARIAEPAKDASPPKAGGIKRPGDYRKESENRPRIVFEKVR